MVQAHRYDESTGGMSTIASLDTVKRCLDKKHAFFSGVLMLFFSMLDEVFGGFG